MTTNVAYITMGQLFDDRKISEFRSFATELVMAVRLLRMRILVALTHIRRTAPALM